MIEKRFLPKQSLSKEDRQKLIEMLKTFFSKENNVAFVYVFGSFNEGKPFRDIDVAAFLFNFKEELSLESDFSFELSKAIGHPVECVVLNRAPVSFQLSVLKKGMQIVNKSEDTRTDFIDEVSRRYREYAHFRNLALET